MKEVYHSLYGIIVEMINGSILISRYVANIYQGDYNVIYKFLLKIFSTYIKPQYQYPYDTLHL